MIHKEIVKAKKITDVISEAKEAQSKSDEAQILLANFLTKRNSKDLDKAFSLLNESNKLNLKSVEPYLALSCMYYIKGKKEISLGILYKAREYEKNNSHLNSLINDIENELVELEIKKRSKKK